MSVLQTVSFSADSIKMRWKEPYVTAGLNQKTLAVLPKGVFTGFNPVSTGAGWGLDLQIDPTLGFSGANVLETTLNKFCVTLIQTTNIALDLTAQAGTTVFLTLDAQYAIGSSTTAQVKVVDLAELALNTDLILLAKVNVPGVAPILASHINTGYRNHAGDALTTESRPAFSLLSNGTFERDVTGAVPMGWVQTGGLTLTTDATVFRTGAKSMKMVAVGASVRSAITNPSPVIPGYKYKAVIWMRSDAGNPIAGGTGVHAQVQFFDLNGSLLTTTDVESTFTGGAIVFEQRSLEVTAPANAANAKFKILFDSCSGWLYVDDIELSSRKTDTLPGGAGVDERFVLYGAPLGLINAFRIDGTNANGAVAGTPFQFTAADVSTVPMVVKQFTGSTQDLEQWQSSAGLSLFKVTSTGTLGFDTDWTLFRQSASEMRLRNVAIFDRHFKFSAFDFPSGTNGNTNFELIGDPALDTGHQRFKIQLGGFPYAGIRIGSEDDVGIRLRQNANDGWLFTNSVDGSAPYDLIAASGAGIVGIRAPGSIGTNGEFNFSDAARLGTVQASRSNLLVNGDMAIWQRQVLSGTLAANTRKYLADRWYVWTGAGGATPYSRQTQGSSPVYGFKYSIRIGRTAANTSTAARGVRQEIDRDLWRTSLGSFGSTSLACSFWARAGADFSAGVNGIQPIFLTGNSGGGTNLYNNTFNAGLGGISNSPSTPFSIVPTTTWTKYTIQWSGQGGDIAAIDFRYFPVGTAGADDWFEITGVMLSQTYGGRLDMAGLPFQLSAPYPGGEIAACERFYEKSYEQEVAPLSVTQTGAIRTHYSGVGLLSWNPGVIFRTRKHPGASYLAFSPSAPDILGGAFYSPVTGALNNAHDGTADIGLDINERSETGIHIDRDATPAAGTIAHTHYVMDVDY